MNKLQYILANNLGLQQKLSLSLCLLLINTSCEKNELQGEESLIGEWSVTKVSIISGDFFVENEEIVGIGESTRNETSGDLGQFNFGEKEMSFNYLKNDSLISGGGSWTLSLDKVRNGFSNENKWQITIAEVQVFDLKFEDGTRNAEKNADKIELENWPKTSGISEAIFLELEKN